MWSRLSEYAENLAEIVAPVDSDDDQAASPRSPLTTDAFACPSASNAPRSAPGSAPRSGNGIEAWSLSRLATMVSSAPASSLSSDDHAALYGADSEQEQYISELERSLLQRKKQNELLEQQLRTLQARSSSNEEQQTEMERLRQRVAELEKAGAGATQQAASTEQERQRTRAALEEQVRVVDSAVRSRVAVLEERLVSVDTRSKQLQLTCQLLAHAPRLKRCGSSSASLGDAAAATTDELFSSLVQVLLVLSKAVAVTEDSTVALPEIPSTEPEIVARILELVPRAKDLLEDATTRATSLQRIISRFVQQHGQALTEAEQKAATPHQFATTVELKLGVLSHRLTKATADEAELETLRHELTALREKERLGRIELTQLHDQLKHERTHKEQHHMAAQQGSVRESELTKTIEDKDALINQLQATVMQLKGSMQHLAKELKASQDEADELEQMCRTQKTRLHELQNECDTIPALQQSLASLQAEEKELRARAEEYEQGYLSLLDEAERLQSANEAEKVALVAEVESNVLSSEKQTLYEMEARLLAAEADKKVAIHDAERLQNELEALEGVMDQFQVDQKQQRMRIAELEKALEETMDRQQRAPTETSVDKQSFETIQNALMKKTHECDRLREALENAAVRYNSDNETLDKRLAAQLVVSYCESDKKHEVMQVMARMMGFTEDQQRRVGLAADAGIPASGNGGGGLFSALFSFGAPSSSTPRHPSASAASSSMGATNGNGDGTGAKSFTDVWTDFLVNEAEHRK
ncbi:TPA: hypothetical protein N0F65_010442 [Lagenidium giganteum]|uniref:GRIP domain-containing protein n=1 Tax=Lagenidium giganteum TaxID=4803 RepID=A0AAV2YUT4_9STRA|nr:TPA: hypothetical protein N0F65_010442 [Lagenidium giganteum]